MPKEARVQTRDSRAPYSVVKDDNQSENNETRPVLASQVIPAVKEVKPRHLAIEEQKTDAKNVARNRRMLGMILGTLQRFQSEESRRKPVTLRRAEIEEKLDKQAEEEKANIRKERKEMMLKKREEKAQLRKTELKTERVEIHEEWEKSHKTLGNFIQTKTKPHIFYLPTKPTPENEKRIKETKEKFRWILAEKRAKVQKELNDIDELYKKDENSIEDIDETNHTLKSVVNDEMDDNNNEELIDGKTETFREDEKEGNSSNNTEDIENMQCEVANTRESREKTQSNLDLITENETNSRSDKKSDTIAEKEFEPIYDED